MYSIRCSLFSKSGALFKAVHFGSIENVTEVLNIAMYQRTVFEKSHRLDVLPVSSAISSMGVTEGLTFLLSVVNR